MRIIVRNYTNGTVQTFTSWPDAIAAIADWPGITYIGASIDRTVTTIQLTNRRTS